MKEIAFIPHRNFSEKDLLRRLQNGNKCMGIKKDSKIIAFSWCNPKEVSFRLHSRPLKKNEAYMFDLFTLSDYRGKGFAPFFSYYFYRELKNIGLTNLISYIDFFNTPSVKFKTKLNAKKVELNLYIELFGKWTFYFTLKNYQKKREQ